MELKVFLVDDAGKTRIMLGDLLSAIGDFRVVGGATTEAEANLWLDQHAGQWDLAIIDLMLEQGAGLSVIARCRAHAAKAKVVVFSGYATPGVRNRCMDLGADAVFDKAEVAPLIEFCRQMQGSASTTAR